MTTTPSTGEAVLIARTATPRLTDLRASELWLLPDGLVRRSRGWRGTLRNYRYGKSSSLRSELPVADAATLRMPVTTMPSSAGAMIRFADIRTAKLSVSATFWTGTSQCFTATMRDGTKHRIWWLGSEPASDILAGALPAVLGDRLTIR